MNRLACHSLLLCALLAGNVAWADVADTTSPVVTAPVADPYEQLAQVSGLDAQVERMPANILSGILESSRSSGDAFQDFMRKAATDAYKAEKMRSQVMASLRRNLSAADVAAVMLWFQSPLGQEFTAAEVAFDQPGNIATARDALRNPPELVPERGHLLEQLDDGLGFSTLMLQVAQDSVISAARIGAMQHGLDVGATLARVTAAFNAQRGRFLAQVRQQTLGTMALTYREQSDEKIAQYVAFNQTEAAQRFNRAVRSGLAIAVNSGTTTLYKASAQYYKQRGMKSAP